MKRKTIKSLAVIWGWTQIRSQDYLLSFRKGKDRINVYWTKMTVGTCIDHPHKGKTQLFRRNVTNLQMLKIFKNPRQHTGKGYYTKK